jgi:hypothetical protein
MERGLADNLAKARAARKVKLSAKKPATPVRATKTAGKKV